jgi:protein-tyrosine phosphatase
VDWFGKRPHREARPSRPHAHPSVTELLPNLLIGEYPRVEDIAWLKSEFGVTAVHSLQDDDDLAQNAIDFSAMRAQCEEAGIRLVRTPIQDGSADHMGERLDDALTALGALVDAGERVYLHCNGGLNRAPTLAIAHLHSHEGMELREALAYVKERRVCGPFMTILEDYFKNRRGARG